MITKKITITNDTGLHSRPADLFVRTAKLFQSNIEVEKEGKSANAKNIVKVILLNANCNSEIEIKADGEDEAEAIEGLSKLIESDFTEIDSRVEI